MKTHTSQFKNKIKEFGRELDSIITYTIDGVTTELGPEQLNSVSPHYQGAILKSVMKQLDIDSNVEIPVGTVINYQFGIKTRTDEVVDYRDNYDYVDYGNYVVKEVEKQEDTYSYKITCYDKLLYAMKEYENSDITFPITVKDYLKEICDKIDLDYAGGDFANSDKVIDNELYLDNEGRSLGYTFRDVLDEIAQVSGGTICLNNNDELEVRYIHDVGTLQTATGSNITITNGQEAELQSFELLGNTTQATTTGKNLASPYIHEQNGVTVAYENGTFKITGKATSTFSLRIINYMTLNGTFTYSLSDLSSSSISVWFWNSTTQVTNPTLNSQQSTVTRTYSADNSVSGNISITSGTTYNLSFKVQIEAGSTATSYEPYTGGVPSPNSQFPSDLVSVGNYNSVTEKFEIEVKETGKNILLVKNSNITPSNWLEYNESTQTFKVKQGTGNFPTAIPININLELGDVISASIIFESGNYTGSNADFVIGLYHKTPAPTAWQGAIQIPKNTSLSGKTYKRENFTINNSVDSFMIFLYGSISIQEDIVFKVQVEKSATATSFEQYKINTQLYQLDSPLRGIGTVKDKLYIQNGMLYVERNIGHIASYDGEVITTSYMSTTGELTTGAEVQYVLDTSVVEELGQVATPSTYTDTTYIDGTGSMNISYISQFETIDEEYLKDVNVNFGEKHGPVNTIVLSRGGDGDKIKYPENMQDEDRIAIQITDNQIMNGNDRDTYMPALYNVLNGLEYFINDFSSTGVCYLDLCDRYRIKIGDNTYKCILFNDEVNITQGLEELIYTDMQEENEQEYKYMSSTDRGITQANIIAKKNEGTIQEITQSIIGEDGLEDRIGRVETTQTATDRTISVISQNITYQYDDAGNPISSEVNAVTTKEKRFTLNDSGLSITSSDNTFKSRIDENGVFFEDGTTTVAEYTKDGSKQKDLRLFGVYYYGMHDKDDTPMFVAQLYTDDNNDDGFGHFYNGGDYS